MATQSAPVKEMTSRQRVLAALRREPVDRTPVCNPTSVATVELMDLADAPFPGALSSVAGNSPPSSYYRLPDALCIQHL